MKIYSLLLLFFPFMNSFAQLPTMTIKQISFERRYGGFLYTVEINNPTKDTLVIMQPDIFDDLSAVNPFNFNINIDKKECDRYYADKPYSLDTEKFSANSIMKFNPKSKRTIQFSQELHSYCMDNDAKIKIKLIYKTPEFYDKKKLMKQNEEFRQLIALLKPAVEYSQKNDLQIDLQEKIADIERQIERNEKQISQLELAEKLNIYKGVIESNEYTFKNSF